jgi:hypothetical protein
MEYLLFLLSYLFQKFQKLLSRAGVDVHHQGEMTTLFHRDELCPWDTLGGKFSF